MARTVYFTASSLDGYLADEAHALSWLFASDIAPDGPFAHEPFMASVGAIVMGRSTLDWVVRELGAAGEPWPYAVPTWVLTHRPLPAVPLLAEADVRRIEGDVDGWHDDALDSADGRDLWVVGGGDVAGRLALAGRLDEVQVALAPVTLGSGYPLMPHRVRLELRDVARNRDFVCVTYAVVGPEPRAAGTSRDAGTVGD